MNKRIHIKSTPINLSALIKQVGVAKASAMLGQTPSALSKHIRNGKAPRSIEIAAQSLRTSNSNQAQAIIRADHETIAAVKRLIGDKGTVTGI